MHYRTTKQQGAYLHQWIKPIKSNGAKLSSWSFYCKLPGNSILLQNLKRSIINLIQIQTVCGFPENCTLGALRIQVLHMYKYTFMINETCWINLSFVYLACSWYGIHSFAGGQPRNPLIGGGLSSYFTLIFSFSPSSLSLSIYYFSTSPSFFPNCQLVIYRRVVEIVNTF